MNALISNCCGASFDPDYGRCRACREHAEGVTADDGVGREAILLDAVLAVVDATRAYLPPDGIDAQECLSRVLAATDNPTINPIILEAENG